jgi:hypothetical protein
VRVTLAFSRPDAPLHDITSDTVIDLRNKMVAIVLLFHVILITSYPPL